MHVAHIRGLHCVFISHHWSRVLYTILSHLPEELFLFVVLYATLIISSPSLPLQNSCHLMRELPSGRYCHWDIPGISGYRVENHLALCACLPVCEMG